MLHWGRGFPGSRTVGPYPGSGAAAGGGGHPWRRPRLAPRRARLCLRRRPRLQTRRRRVRRGGYRARGGARRNRVRGSGGSVCRRSRHPGGTRRARLCHMRRSFGGDGCPRRHRHQRQDHDLLRSLLHPRRRICGREVRTHDDGRAGLRRRASPDHPHHARGDRGAERPARDARRGGGARRTRGLLARRRSEARHGHAHKGSAFYQPHPRPPRPARLDGGVLQGQARALLLG